MILEGYYKKEKNIKIFDDVYITHLKIEDVLKIKKIFGFKNYHLELEPYQKETYSLKILDLVNYYYIYYLLKDNFNNVKKRKYKNTI